ncbi:hypothetical protein Afil01_68120 [Actinorhabdospora filicis]|uniref:Uncharacterized protein n=1 Tax=Actinorhabdospora filicis TaxID=1785913 RepID=A0A9W6SU59_9ACTN|nr:hypothetical protein Afil01_68120 [Actinorhabdospora filicis]
MPPAFIAIAVLSGTARPPGVLGIAMPFAAAIAVTVVLVTLLVAGVCVLSNASAAILDLRGERVTATVVARYGHDPAAYALARPGGSPIAGRLSGGDLRPGESVVVIADPGGRIRRGRTRCTRTRLWRCW